MVNARLSIASLTLWAALSGVSAAAPDFFGAVECWPDLNADFQRKMVYLPNVEAERPTLDGRLDEPLWQRAFRFSGFVELESGLPIPPEEAITGYVCRGEKGLYVAVTGKDIVPPPWKNWGKVDPGLPELRPAGSDAFYVQLNPDIQKLDRYRFVAARGNVRSQLRRFVSPPWNPGQWESCYREEGDTITAEFFIPYEILSMPALRRGDLMAFNLFKAASTPIPVPGGPYRHPVPSHYTWACNYGHSNAQADHWAWLYCGTEAEFKAASLPPVTRLYLDRAAYRRSDERGEGYVEVRWGTTPLTNLALTLTVADAAGQVLHTKTNAASLGSPEVGFSFHPALLPPGAYRLEVTVLHQGKAIRTAQRAFEVLAETDASTKLPESVELVMTENNDLGTGTRAISTGIPFPRGALFDKDMENLRVERLVRTGKDPADFWRTEWVEVPCQVTVRNRWYREGSIKWLGLDFPVEYYRGKSKSPHLRWGGTGYRLALGKPRTPVAQPLRVTETQEGIEIVTGPMKAVVSKTAFRLISAAWLDRNGDGAFEPTEQILLAGKGDGLTHTRPDGTVFTAADPRTRVWTEEVGPVKATIVAEGWHWNGEQRNGRHLTRMTFYRGQPYVRIKHTYILTVDTHKEAIRNVAVKLGVPGTARYAFSGGDGARIAGALKGAASVYQLQLRADRYAVERERAGRQVGDEVLTGARSAGWAAAESPAGTALLAADRVWQLYPKELEVRADGLTFHPWPRHGREVFSKEEILDPLNIPKALFAHHGESLTLKCPDEVYEEMGRLWSETHQKLGQQKAVPGSPPAYIFDYAYEAWKANGQGLAMTSELTLHLLPPEATFEEQSAWARTHQAAAQAVADPKWTHRTGVLGELWPQDRERFGAIEAAIDRTHGMVSQNWVEKLGDYGAWIWPDHHTYPSSFVTGEFESMWLHRTWLNTHYQNGRTEYLLYLRSGEDTYWQSARDSTRHKMDVSTVNYGERPAVGPHQAPWGGYHAYCIFGWGGSQGTSCHWQNLDYKTWDYFLTGDPRGLMQAQGWAQELARTCWAGEASRDGLGTVEEAIPVYEATHDPRLLKVIHQFKQAFVEVPMDQVVLPHYTQTAWQRMVDYTRDPAIVARLTEQWNDGDVKPQGLGSAITRLTLYRITGDRRIPAAMRLATSVDSPIIDFAEPNFSRNMMNAPYVMSLLEAVGADEGVLLNESAYQRFWKPELDQWKKKGKKIPPP
jgi:hypothetical protein